MSKLNKLPFCKKIYCNRSKKFQPYFFFSFHNYLKQMLLVQVQRQGRCVPLFWLWGLIASLEANNSCDLCLISPCNMIYGTTCWPAPLVWTLSIINKATYFHKLIWNFGECCQIIHLVMESQMKGSIWINSSNGLAISDNCWLAFNWTNLSNNLQLIITSTFQNWSHVHATTVHSIVTMQHNGIQCHIIV